MAKEISDQQRALTRSARQAAMAAGKNWAQLSKEEKRAFKKGARGRLSNRAVPANVAKARKAAEAAGKKWAALSQEERKTYLKQAREKS